VVDFTYRLPDGSIKSFPDTTSEQDIKWFVAKNFPGRPGQGWLAGPISQHRVRKFDDGTLATMAKLHDVAKPYADRLGVDPYLAVGGPAEELDTIRRTDPIGDPLSFVGNPFLDVRARNYFWRDHNALSQDLEDAKKVDQSRGVNAWKKFWHPVLADLGPGNIKLAHAIELLRRYSQRFPDSDPLQLKEKYNLDYKGLGRDLADWDNLEATAKFAALDAADAVAFFQREAPRTWASADKFKKLGLVSTYYNRGREQMVRDAREERNLGGYDPVPGFGGEWSTENGPALSQAIEGRRRAEAMGRWVGGLPRSVSPSTRGLGEPSIDPTTTKSIARGAQSARQLGGWPTSVPDRLAVAPYARLLRLILGGLASTRPSPGPETGTAANGGGFDTVAVTRMIRQMQQAGASADEVRQMIAENRRRASAARSMPR
jgi:hypothetical protein